MIYMNVYAKNEQKVAILDWMIEQIRIKGELSLNQLLLQHMNDVTLVDNDTLGFHDVGWNVNDLIRLYKSRQDTIDLEIPQPRCRFRKRYT